MSDANHVRNFFITEMHVKGIGVFKELDISFNKEFNIIMGENATGKTTILKCISALGLSVLPRGLGYHIEGEYWIDFVQNGQSCRSGVGSWIMEEPLMYRDILGGTQKAPPPRGNHELIHQDKFSTFFCKCL